MWRVEVQADPKRLRRFCILVHHVDRMTAKQSRQIAHLRVGNVVSARKFGKVSHRERRRTDLLSDKANHDGP
jgi:hypothetical protein